MAADEVSLAVERVLAALRGHGLLLLQDRALPSVVAVVTGEAPRASWWGHPRGKTVFAVLAALAEREDVLFTKLVGGKVTLLHRRLWPAFLAVARAHERWQLRGLSARARRMLGEVERGGLVASGKPVAELEARLLVHARQVHTASGDHALALEGWDAWARRRRVRPERSLTRARERLERAALALGVERDALPWPEE